MGYPFEYLSQEARNRGIVVDTNLFVVLLVGSVNPELLQKDKRTSSYTKEDFFTLLRTVAYFQKRWITHSVATEACNLLDSLNRGNHLNIFAKMRQMIAHSADINAPCIPITETPGFEKFGFADASIVMLAQRGILVLTDDLPLYGLLSNLRLKCVNFNHVRYWDLSSQ